MEFSLEATLPRLATADWSTEGTFCSTLSPGGLFSNGKALLPDSPASSARRLPFPSFCFLPSFLLQSDLTSLILLQQLNTRKKTLNLPHPQAALSVDSKTQSERKTSPRFTFKLPMESFPGLLTLQNEAFWLRLLRANEWISSLCLSSTNPLPSYKWVHSLM